jgi:chorismate mutase/prephenate dehydratase
LPFRAKPWEYIFFVEMDGHVADESVASALEKLETLCRDVKILGSYPRGTR